MKREERRGQGMRLNSYVACYWLDVANDTKKFVGRDFCLMYVLLFTECEDFSQHSYSM